jgi:hypothetical protein
MPRGSQKRAGHSCGGNHMKSHYIVPFSCWPIGLIGALVTNRPHHRMNRSRRCYRSSDRRINPHLAPAPGPRPIGNLLQRGAFLAAEVALNPRTGTRASLSGMTDLTDFITHAFKTIARAVAEAGVNADLFKAPELIQKTLKRRVSAELKRLAVLLRPASCLQARRRISSISCAGRSLCRRADLCLPHPSSPAGRRCWRR